MPRSCDKRSSAAISASTYIIHQLWNNKPEDAPGSIDKAIKAFESSGIDEYEEFYKMLQNWRGEVINSFTRINGRRINNSYMESKNKEVGRLIFSANGFKNFKRTSNRMLYCLNGEDTFKI